MSASFSGRRETHTFPFMATIASFASWGLSNVTKPNPLDLQVSRSLTTSAVEAWQHNISQKGGVEGWPSYTLNTGVTICNDMFEPGRVWPATRGGVPFKTFPYLQNDSLREASSVSKHSPPMNSLPSSAILNYASETKIKKVVVMQQELMGKNNNCQPENKNKMTSQQTERQPMFPLRIDITQPTNTLTRSGAPRRATGARRLRCPEPGGRGSAQPAQHIRHPRGNTTPVSDIPSPVTRHLQP